MTIEWWSNYHAEIRPVAAEVTNALPEEVEQVVGGGDEGATILGGQQHLGDGREDQDVGLGTNLVEAFPEDTDVAAEQNLRGLQHRGGTVACLVNVSLDVGVSDEGEDTSLRHDKQLVKNWTTP